MARKFAELREKMSAAARAESERELLRMMAEMQVCEKLALSGEDVESLNEPPSSEGNDS